MIKHLCPQLPPSYLIRFNDGWVLYHRLGYICLDYAIPIVYCPFCGLKLER